MWQKIKCFFGHHRMRSVQRFSYGSERAKCTCCNYDIVLNHDLRVVLKWDADIEWLCRALGDTVLNPKFSDGKPLNNFGLKKCHNRDS